MTIKKNYWYYPTNQLNLGYSLARGLITDPRGYGKKYYADLLQDYPGWLPLFPGLNAEQLEQVTRDAAHLVPVVLELDPRQLQGDAWAVNAQGESKAIRLPDELDKADHMLLLPLPLPVNLFRKIYFADAAAKKDALDRWQSQYRNTAIPDHARLGTRKNLFQVKTPAELFSDSKTSLAELPEPPAVPLNQANALGALRALLFHYAHRWQNACEFYEWLFLDKDDFKPQDKVLQQARQWRDDPASAAASNDEVGLFWFIVNQVRDTDTNATDALLHALDLRREQMPEKFQQRLKELDKILRGLRGLDARMLDDLFEQNPKPFARALILFFVLDSSQQLLDYQEAQPNPMDMLYALILFAARDGWMKLAPDLRQGTRFTNETNDFMARWIQQQNTQRLSWPADAAPMLPLYRRLAPLDTPREEKKAAQLRLELARKMQWECIHTQILLLPGEYPLQVSTRGLAIRFAGEPRHITIGVDNEDFFKRLENAALPANILVEIIER